MPNSKYIPVLRVTQLDTNELDESLISTLKQSLNQDIFKYIQHSFFQKYNTEIFTTVKFFLWYYTFNKRSQTVGQSILNWSYLETNKINRVKKIIHCLFFCCGELFVEKFPDFICFILNYLKKNQNQDLDDDLDLTRKAEKITNVFLICFRSISFFHYLQFLFDGKYLRLWERILSLKPSYIQEQYIKSYRHDINEREELWQTYFSLFKLIDSLINFGKIYSKVSKSRTKNLSFDDDSNYKICTLCENSPSLVHRSINYEKLETCKHVFCYLCIKKELIENQNKFECPKCKKVITDIELFNLNSI